MSELIITDENINNINLDGITTIKLFKPHPNAIAWNKLCQTISESNIVHFEAYCITVVGTQRVIEYSQYCEGIVKIINKCKTLQSICFMNYDDNFCINIINAINQSAIDTVEFHNIMNMYGNFSGGIKYRFNSKFITEFYIADASTQYLVQADLIEMTDANIYRQKYIRKLAYTIMTTHNSRTGKLNDIRTYKDLLRIIARWLWYIQYV